MRRSAHQMPEVTSSSVRSVSEASIRRIAGSDNWLPPVGGPANGIKVTAEDFPFAVFVTRPAASAVTKGVFSQKPGSVGLPRLAIVVPRLFVPAGDEAGAAASARWAAVVVSSASCVLAAAGGGNADVRTDVGGAVVAAPRGAAGAESGRTMPNCAQALRPIAATVRPIGRKGYLSIILMPLQYATPHPAPTPIQIRLAPPWGHLYDCSYDSTSD